MNSKDFSCAPLALAHGFLKGSELWASDLKVVYNGVIMGL